MGAFIIVATPSVSRPAVSGQSSTDDRGTEQRSTTVDQDLELLRRCVSDLGWTFEALEAEMRKDKSYIHRVLHGDKPLTYKFLKSLPGEVQAEFHSRSAEAFGRVVVAPVRGAEAVRNFVSGLLGVLAPQFPATRMVKASIGSGAARAKAVR